MFLYGVHMLYNVSCMTAAFGTSIRKLCFDSLSKGNCAFPSLAKRDQFAKLKA